MIINYSSRRRSETVAVAKNFAAALGLGKGELDSVGKDSVQDFHLDKVGRNGRELCASELRFTHQGDLWELYLNSGQNIPE
jgi:hypothetical protein